MLSVTSGASLPTNTRVNDDMSWTDLCPRPKSVNFVLCLCVCVCVGVRFLVAVDQTLIIGCRMSSMVWCDTIRKVVQSRHSSTM
jgi:hypothetical protein